MRSAGWWTGRRSSTRCCRCSYGPYARAMIRICKEESFHQRQGFEILWTLARVRPPSGRWPRTRWTAGGTRRWRCSARRMPSRPTPSGPWPEDQAVLQRHAAAAVRGHDRGAGGGAGAAPARPHLRWNPQRGSYDFTPPDYDELRRVISGDGPCNRQRMAHRRAAHADGAWVRGAAGVRGQARDRSGVTRGDERSDQPAADREPRSMSGGGGGSGAVKPERAGPLWRCSCRRGSSHVHVGSLHAPDAATALRHARDV